MDNDQAEQSLTRINLDSHAQYDSDSDDSSVDSDDVSTLTSSQAQQNEYNVILLGSSESGKSALVNRFMDTEVFVKVYHETLVDVYH